MLATNLGIDAAPRHVLDRLFASVGCVENEGFLRGSPLCKRPQTDQDTRVPESLDPGPWPRSAARKLRNPGVPAFGCGCGRDRCGFGTAHVEGG